jgi:hypothetical protein
MGAYLMLGVVMFIAIGTLVLVQIDERQNRKKKAE